MDFDDSALLGALLRDDEDGDEWLGMAQNTLQQGWHAPGASHGRGQLCQTEALAAQQQEPQEQQQRQQQQQQQHQQPEQQQLLHIGQQPEQRLASHRPSSTQQDAMQHSDEHDASSKQPPATNVRAAVRRAAKARERAALADLEVRLQNVSALHVQLLAENGMLRRRMRLLESGVQMREQHLQSLLKARRERPRARSHSSSGLLAGPRAGGADAAGDKAGTAEEPCRMPAAAEAAAPGTAAPSTPSTAGEEAALAVKEMLIPAVPMDLGLAPGSAAADDSAAANGAAQQEAPAAGSTAAKKATTDSTAATPFAGGTSHARPSNNGSCAVDPSGSAPPLCWTSFSQFADPEAWDTEMCAIVRGLCPHDYQRMWTDFCREASLLAVSAQAHGPGSDSAVALAALVSTCLSVTDRIAALNPCAYNESMYTNLLTGKPQVPGDDYWRACMRIVPMTPEQLEFCRTAMDDFDRRIGPLMDERTKIADELKRKLMLSTVAAHDVTERLENNVRREYAANSFLADFLTLQVLTPVQVALMSAAAFPLLPDPTAMAAAALELAHA